MYEVLDIVLISIFAFAFTSFEDLLLLMGFQITPQSQLPSILGGILIGYLIAVIIIQLLGFLSAYAADFVTSSYIGYLGIIPIILGVHSLWKIYWERSETFSSATVQGNNSQAMGVSLTMLANSGDTLGVFLPLYAETPEPLTFVIFGVSLILAGLWFSLSRWLIHRQQLNFFLQKTGRFLLPVILIAMGLYILQDSSTDTLVSLDAKYLFQFIP